MEMEHINENTIRVLIKSEDLAARGITFLDLLGNHNEIENFFYSILEEVDIDEEFKGSEVVTFQVLPKGDGLELFISKNLPPEGMENFDDMSDGSTEDITDMLKKHVASQLQETESQPELGNRFIFELNSFEAMVQLASEVYLDSVTTNLYQMNDRYYLEVQFMDNDTTDIEVENALAYLMEFANRTQVTSEVLAEYGKIIMEHDALELTRYYFKNV
ncbi:adaptor protein MecA [Enterococcus gallinarum]|uniref:Adapter protein MecA n=1 Tax=Enterococcus gallinarum TaxID=1353 RepID=A0ABD4HP80_ENTGA|nr:adaptor protein MecA [Enterococcus gallinarum]MBA0948983.1 adaptor protein MecA [Enterococcus gallinarum]MBA0961987.1 adaptor protein MecA [Enterococcus gallinarum]MBA0969932.1 adaptor protein MecA [Enterococcus gallinarum]MBA0973302.1 adaptor protein MecA [Enterococcus gallinarum]NVI96102.1 adaptor protein MecA [Enterococcus gallinarum]